MAEVLAGRRARWAFAAGWIAVTAGVLLHLPMFVMARNMGYRLAGMPMDRGMLAGMGLILGGLTLAAWGLLPARSTGEADAEPAVTVIAPDDAPLSRAHLTLMAVLAAALVIDVMKPASLGFVVPGMIAEYGLARSVVALLPFSALVGTVVGSILWGALADLYGRKAAILLAAILFVGTSICGAMPSFWWNVGMCFLMGAGAGGMLPVTYALIAETMPARHRGWSLVLVGGLGAIGGYLLASGLSWLLQPLFGWRIMWFLNLPTGLLLLLLGRLMPESAKFLIMRGRSAEAIEAMRPFGSAIVRPQVPEPTLTGAPSPPLSAGLAGRTVALSVTALAWGLINFGLLLWLPNDLVARGWSMTVASGLLARSALLALPTVFVAAWLYGRWSAKGALGVMIAVTALGLVGVLAIGARGAGALAPILSVALLIIGGNGVIAILLPYAAETYPLAVRGRATGWVAACTKAGGIAPQVMGMAAAIPPLGVAAMAILAPIGLALVLTLRFGAEPAARSSGSLQRLRPTTS
jgi:putative MFS transporter